MEELKGLLKESIDNGNWKSVIFYSEYILKEDSGSFEAFFGKAVALFATEKFRELEQWMQILPQNVQSNIHLLTIRCKALILTRDYNRIITLLGGVDESSMVIEPIVSNNIVVQNKHLNHYREMALFNTENSDHPPNPLKSVIIEGDELHPKNVTRDVAEAMMNHDPSIIYKYTTSSFSRGGNDSYLLTAVACSKLLHGQLANGQALLTRATEIDPNNEIAWLCIINTFMVTEEWNQAISTLKAVSQRFPDSDNVAMFAITIHIRSMAPTIAWSWIKKVKKTNDFVLHEQAVVSYYDGSIGAAEKLFEKIYRRTSEKDIKASSALNLAHCYRRRGEFKKAIELYFEGIRLGCKQSEALVSIGFAYHLLGNFDKAIEFYNKALSDDPVHHFAAKMLDTAFGSYKLPA